MIPDSTVKVFAPKLNNVIDDEFAKDDPEGLLEHHKQQVWFAFLLKTIVA